MKPLWSILICTLPERRHFLTHLLIHLDKQLTDRIEVLTDDRTDISIGQKRNDLVSRAKGIYSSFIDDDDLISENYVKRHLEVLTKMPMIDGIGFYGIMTYNGRNPRKFKHSAHYDYATVQRGVTSIYERPLNHLNVVKNYFRRAIPFPDFNHGEDYDQCLRMKEAIDPNNTTDITGEPMYFYQVRSDVSTTEKRSKQINQKL